MAESKMPARIWATQGTPCGFYSPLGPDDSDDPVRHAYIRADLVERMAEALKEARDALNGAPNTIGLHSQIDTALTSYREASNVES